MQAPGEALLIRLWDTLTERSIGALLRPWQLRREGRALTDVRSQELLRLAQAERDAQDIRSGLKRLGAGGALESAQKPADARDEEMLLQRAFDAQLADGLRREVNVGRTLLLTEGTLESDSTSPPANKPNADWLYRWRDAAAEVSQPEMQRLWASVLAGEVKQPSTFSLRTLEFMRNLTTTEASLIEKVLKFRLSGSIYRLGDEYFDTQGLPFALLLSLQDLGVLSGVEAIGLTQTHKSQLPGQFGTLLIGPKQALVISHAEETRPFRIPVFKITMLGMELSHLVDDPPPNDYLDKVAQAVHGMGFDVHLAGYQRVDGVRIELGDTVPLAVTPPPTAPGQ